MKPSERIRQLVNRYIVDHEEGLQRFPEAYYLPSAILSYLDEQAEEVIK